jgi:hypothetical protein
MNDASKQIWSVILTDFNAKKCWKIYFPVKLFEYKQDWLRPVSKLLKAVYETIIKFVKFVQYCSKLLKVWKCPNIKTPKRQNVKS